jgi:hypothetical protein
MMATPMLAPSANRLDVGSLVYDTHTSFNPLSKEFMFDFEVSEIRDGYVVLSLALPEGMTRVFVSMLESMSGLFKFMDRKVKVAAAVQKSQQRTIDPAIREHVQDKQADFKNQACDLYDGFLAGGHSSAESLKLTNSALKAKNHPWASYDLVKSLIGSTGRFRKKKGVI